MKDSILELLSSLEKRINFDNIKDYFQTLKNDL